VRGKGGGQNTGSEGNVKGGGVRGGEKGDQQEADGMDTEEFIYHESFG